MSLSLANFSFIITLQRVLVPFFNLLQKFLGGSQGIRTTHLSVPRMTSLYKKKEPFYKEASGTKLNNAGCINSSPFMIALSSDQIFPNTNNNKAILS